MVLAVCREWLMTLAREELPDVPERESELQPLVDGALRQVPAILSSLAGASEPDLYAELRRVFFDQLHTFSGRPATDLADPPRGDVSTRRPGSGDTPRQADSAGTPPTVDAPPPTDHPEGRESLPDATPQGVQTVPESDSAAAAGRAGRVPPGLSQLEGFENISEVAAGGMGIVYRAWQARLKRWVALKCLPPEFAEDPDRLRRFRQEAVLAAGLTEPGIVQVYDVLEHNGAPILVLPFIDGCDLNKIVSQRRLLRDGKDVPDPQPLAKKTDRDYAAGMLPFFDRVLDALVGLHGAGVLHRDLKPSNILVDRNGNGWLTDFGLARLDRPDSTAHQRQVMGTRGFMSPEQWEGDEGLDARTDVFAMGVTIFETLTLELPYGKSRITAATPPATLPKARQSLLPQNLDLVLQKAIHPDWNQRYQTAADLRDDWQRVRKGLLPKKVLIGTKRRVVHVAGQRAVLAGAAVAVMLAVVIAYLLMPPSKVVRTVVVTTEPPGAKIALLPLDDVNGRPQFDRAIEPKEKTPVKISGVPPGDYLVVAEVPGHGFHEVFRRVPAPGESDKVFGSQDSAGRESDRPSDDPPVKIYGFPHLAHDVREGEIVLPPVIIPATDGGKGMTLIAGAEFTMGDPELKLAAPPHRRRVESFYLDTTEVTVAQFRSIRKKLPEQLTDLSPHDEEPVRFIDFNQAVRYAEQVGKRLPDEAEYEFAATNGGVTRFPWGDAPPPAKDWTIGAVGSPAYDRSSAGVCGLFSNVVEWTSSWHAPYPGVTWPPDMLAKLHNQRIVRGGKYWVAQGKPVPPKREKIGDARYRYGVEIEEADPGIGFRCARSVKPRFPGAPPGG
jgi:hypothetical protein